MTDHLADLIDRYPGAERADKVVAALRGLAVQTTYARIVMCELAWEIRIRAYWTVVRRPDGTPYAGYYALMCDVLGRDLQKSALDTLSQLGHALTDWPATSREWARQQLTTLGWSRAKHFMSPLKKMKGDVEALGKLISLVDQAPTWRQASRLISATCQTMKQGGKHLAQACPTCGRVLRKSKGYRRVQRPPSEVAERLLKEASA